jgi:hypothetical protein
MASTYTYVYITFESFLDGYSTKERQFTLAPPMITIHTFDDIYNVMSTWRWRLNTAPPVKVLGIVDIFPNPVQRVYRCSSSDMFLQSFAWICAVFLGGVAAHWAIMIVEAHTIVLLHLFVHATLS